MIKIENFCKEKNLGKVINITKLTGGLMHKMFKVETDKGVYAVKILNPEVMKRKIAYNNFVVSETISNLAKENGIKEIAFPCISTGVFRFPRELAVQCAFEAVNEFLENDEDNTINRVVFCVYSNEDLKIYDNYIKRLNKVNY